MFKNFEMKFETETQLLLGWSHELSGTNSHIHRFYFGPWMLTVVVYNNG